MVLRSLIKLSGGQPGPAPTWRMPQMKRSERKGHAAFSLLFAANAVGGIACTMFVLRYLLVRDRGLISHVERDPMQDPKGQPWIQLFTHQNFGEYKVPASKPQIPTFQPLLESGRIGEDHGEEDDH